MISIAELIKRHQLRNLTTRVEEVDHALDLSHGLYVPADGDLLPRPANRNRRQAWDRALRQMQTLGPRVMETKLNAIVGDVTWGGKDDELDDDLMALDTRALANGFAHQYIVTGITGGYAHNDERGFARISRLGGYLEPYTHPDNVDVINGIYQAWQVTRDNIDRTRNAFDDNASVRYLSRWMVRVYDWSDSAEGECVMRQWDNLTDPTKLANAPDSEDAAHPRPRYRIRTMSQDGLPIGELLMAMPQMKALWATEARLVLSEELAAFPMLKAFGPVNTGNDDGSDAPTVGASEVWTGGSEATLEWMQPGNLEELRLQRTLRLDRIRDDLALPGGFLGRDSPSGEALKEANVRFRQNSEGYARDISGLLSELVEDFAVLTGSTPATVAVIPSQAYDETSRVSAILQLYQANLLPLGVAATAIQPFYPQWSDDELTAWVADQTARVTLSDFDALAGDGA